MFSVTTINADRTLLTIDELRAAAGVADGSRDAALQTLGNRVAASIARACRVAQDGVTPPTLRLEAVSDTLRFTADQPYLFLSRRPIVGTPTVTENDEALVAADVEIAAAAGMLRRLSGDSYTCWPSGKIVIAYSAGYETVPDDLKFAAVKYVQAEVRGDGRDPMLRRKVTEGVSEYEWWVDPTKESVIPAEVMDLLHAGGYVNTWIG